MRKFFRSTLSKKGQSVVEFMLLMGTIVTLCFMFFVLFHEKLAGFFFFLIGSILD